MGWWGDRFRRWRVGRPPGSRGSLYRGAHRAQILPIRRVLYIHPGSPLEAPVVSRALAPRPHAVSPEARYSMNGIRIEAIAPTIMTAFAPGHEPQPPRAQRVIIPAIAGRAPAPIVVSATPPGPPGPLRPTALPPPPPPPF